MTTHKLRGWRGVKPVASPCGVAITTRLRTTPEDDRVLDLVGAHVGRLRRADLARVCQPVALDPRLDDDAKRQMRRDRLNTRKKALTSQSSARWANAVIAGNDDQYRLARDGQYRHMIGLRAAIATVEKRLAAPTADALTAAERKTRRKTKAPKGYATHSERFEKQRRVAHLRAELARAEQQRAAGRVHVVEGGTRLARNRHHLDAADMTVDQWRDRWDAARYRITANGSPDEPFGNLTITVTPGGVVSVRLPKPLEHLANATRGRYILSGTAVFAHRGAQWAQRITSANSVSYTITRRPGRAGRYLCAAWAIPALPYWVGRDNTTPDSDVYAVGPVVGVDLNDGHLALRRLDAHGNPVGTAQRINFDLSGTSARRDAHLRHAITGLIHYTQTSRHQHDRGRGPGLRRCTGHRQGDDGPRRTRETLPRHRGRAAQRGIPPASGRASPYGRHPTVGGQSRLLQHLG
jgi:hypothetical protein